MTETNKYNNGKIYTIRSYKTDKFYIGSTIQPLYKRFNEHKTDKNCNMTSKIIIEYGDAYIELLENFSCNNKEELNKREGELIRLHKDNIVNKYINGRTKEEWYNDNKDKFKQQHLDNKKHNNIISKNHYNDNKEYYLELAKLYRKNNKDKIIESNKATYKCDCGSLITKNYKSKHNKNKKHLQYINNIKI